MFCLLHELTNQQNQFCCTHYRTFLVLLAVKGFVFVEVSHIINSVISAVDILVILREFKRVHLKPFASIFCAVVNEPQKGIVGVK